MCVVVVVVEFSKCTLVQRGRFSATIGYVAPTPNHERIHRVQQSKIRVPVPHSATHGQNVQSRAPSRAQTPNPSNPAKGTPKGETHKDGPPLCPRTNTPPLPSPPPAQKTLKKPPSNPCPRSRSPYCHVIVTAHQILPLPAALSQPRTWSKVSRQIAMALSSLRHTVCP